MHCLQNLQTSFFNKIFIKIKFYDIIYIFKNYFITVFSVFSKISATQSHSKCPFNKNDFCQLILVFSLFLILFIGLTILFGTIYEFHYTILANFYFYLQYFQQKNFSFRKIS